MHRVDFDSLVSKEDALENPQSASLFDQSGLSLNCTVIDTNIIIMIVVGKLD